MSGELLLAVPIAVAALIWWESSRRTGKWGMSLPVFLLGYGLVMTFHGFRDLARGWEQIADDVGKCILDVVLLTGAAYVVGLFAWGLRAEAGVFDSMNRGWLLAKQESPQ